MAKKTFAILGNVYHGAGRNHRLYRAGEEIELDVDDADQRETIAELLARDFLEDPERPKQRTPQEKARIEERQIAGERVEAATKSAARSEQAAAVRSQNVEDGIQRLTAEDERKERERVRRQEAAS